VLDGLAIAIAPDPAGADFVLNTGPVSFGDTLDDYRGVLAEAAGLELPMVCANPDLEVIREGRRVICAGLIARAYEEIGGEVGYRGKPYPDVYHRSLERLGVAERALAVGIGDSLRTDLAGARAAGIDSIFVAGGIHADELGVKEGALPDPAAVTRLCERAGESPVAAIPAFVW
jgi:HAD superfamily hydrolase (TIGR01459 family)